jgi:hypothetical protein
MPAKNFRGGTTMKRYLFAILSLAILAVTYPAFALDGQVVAVSGKAEYQDASGNWKTLKAGDPLTAGTMVSTGFKSEATVKLGASILTIKPLTRMTLTQLIEKEDTVTTELYLEVGNVKAEVNSLNSKKNGFTVKSPVATASVRGTVFEIGDELIIHQGTVVMVTPIGQTRTGTAGQQLEIVGSSIASPATALETKMEKIALSSTPSTEVTSVIAATTAAAPVAAPIISAATTVEAPIQTATLSLTIN